MHCAELSHTLQQTEKENTELVLSLGLQIFSLPMCCLHDRKTMNWLCPFFKHKTFFFIPVALSTSSFKYIHLPSSTQCCFPLSTEPPSVFHQSLLVWICQQTFNSTLNLVPKDLFPASKHFFQGNCAANIALLLNQWCEMLKQWCHQ